MSIKERAAQALAEREESLEDFAKIGDFRALEAHRLAGLSEEERLLANLDFAILARKRAIKGELDVLDRWADLYDKAALPAAAAVPAFLTFLASEKVVVDPVRSTVLAAAYLFGGSVWIFCRWMAHRLSCRAKRGAADLGKVD